MIQLAYHRHVLFKRVVTMCVEDGLTWCPVCVYFIMGESLITCYMYYYTIYHNGSPRQRPSSPPLHDHRCGRAMGASRLGAGGAFFAVDARTK